MPLYTAYGLSIDSGLELPELLAPAVRGECDVTIRQTAIDKTDLAIQPGELSAAIATRDSATMWYAGAGTFVVRGGNEILFSADTDADDRTVRLYLLGPVLGLLLHQRGSLVLHASSILINGQAVAFVADKGTGKSTLAAAFHADGFTLVSDDLVAVDLHAGGGAVTQPGFPQLKLFPEAAAQLEDAPDDLPALMPNFDKRACRSNGPFATGAIPIRTVYVLGDGASESIENMPAQQAFMQLVKHSFNLSAVQATKTEADHFAQIIKLAACVRVRHLSRRRNLALLPQVVRMVEADCAAA